MRGRLLFVFLAVTACLAGSRDEKDDRPDKYERWAKRLDEQFWPFPLDEYQIVTNQVSVVRGLGGRWITVRYTLKDNQQITRDAMVERITKALTYYGWKRAEKPTVRYVLSKIYETDQSDLHFQREPFTDHDVAFSYQEHIHISKDAKVLVLYCEAAW